MATQHKTKQYLLVTVKVLLVAITFGYIYYRLQNNANLDFSLFVKNLFAKGAGASYFYIILLVLAALNWTFEIQKWKSLVSTIEEISFYTASQQSLASLTVSLATPNRIGEYGAKAMFFESGKRKRVLVLNFFSNTAQLFVTIFCGITGLLYILYKYTLSYSQQSLLLFGILIISAVSLAYVFRNKEILLKRFSVAKIIGSLSQLPVSIKLQVLSFSLLRYIVFSCMFYSLLIFFGAHIPLVDAMAFIFSTYLLVSIVPTIFLMDVVVRSGVAVWLFSYAGVPELPVLSTVLSMWILNFVLPAIVGSFFVLSYQPATR